MFLIAEYLEDTTKPIIEEAENGQKKLYIEGVFLQAEIVNRNKRIYPKSVLDREVNKYIEERVKPRRALGELNHPPRPHVDPAEASHRIVELRENGNDYIGKALILNTPKGQIVKGLIEGGTQIGVSSRGLGTVKKRKDGISEVNSDYSLRTIDIVSDPSAPNAFVNGIMEMEEWAVMGAGEEKAEKIRKFIRKTPRRRLEEAILESFKSLFDDVRIEL